MEWDASDRGKALAFAMEKSERCVMCGTAEWEWEADRDAYAPVEKWCKGCYLKHIAEDNDNPETPAGTSWSLMPTKGRAHAHQLIRQKRAWEERGSANGLE